MPLNFDLIIEDAELFAESQVEVSTLLIKDENADAISVVDPVIALK
jgi:hypothetical protein